MSETIEVQPFPANGRLGFQSRSLGFRAKQAIRFLGKLNGAEVTAEQLRSNTQNVNQRPYGATMHNFYTPNDLRTVRERLDPSIMERIANKNNGLPPIVATHVSKGGVGKTSVSVSLAVSLAMQGYKVLAIDGDPQASMTDALGVNSNLPGIFNLSHLMGISKEVDPKEIVVSIYDDAVLHLIPADIEMDTLDLELKNTIGGESLLKRQTEGRLKKFLAGYDIVVIDTGPGSTTLNFALISVSNLILGVMSLDGMSLKALSKLNRTIATVEAVVGKKVPLLLLANKFHHGHKKCIENFELMRKLNGDILYESPMPVYAGFDKQVDVWAPENSRPLFEEEPSSPAGEIVLELSRHILASVISPPREVEPQDWQREIMEKTYPPVKARQEQKA